MVTKQLIDTRLIPVTLLLSGKDYDDRPSRPTRSMTMGSAPPSRSEVDPSSAVDAYRNRPRSSFRPEGLSAINTNIPLIGHSKGEARDKNSARSAVQSPVSIIMT